MQIKMLFRRNMQLLLALLMLMFLAPSTMAAADDWSYPTSKPSQPFGGGSGTPGDPFIISTAQHLANLAYMVSSKGKDYEGQYFKQTADIVLNDNVVGGAKKEDNGSIRYIQNKEHFDNMKRWQPIGMYGTYFDNDFEGIYDGGGHSISGIYCRKPIETSEKAYRYIGLFSTCDDARISNLTIKDSFFSLCAPDYNAYTVSLGTLIGLSTNTIVSNCHAENCVISGDGDILAINWKIGGLIGEVQGSFTAKGCSFENGVIDPYYEQITSGSAIEFFIGGIVGAKGINDYFDKSFYMEDCSTSGKLDCHNAKQSTIRYGRAYFGGMIGCFEKAKTETGKPHILRCTNKMEINPFGGSVNLTRHTEFRVCGISCGDNTICSECINFGNIGFGGGYLKQPAGTIFMSGISAGGTIDHCFNYGDLGMGMWLTNNNAVIGQWIFKAGKVSNSFACNTIKYRSNDGYGLKTYNGAKSENGLEMDNVKCYTTINGTVEKVNIGDADNTYFTKQETVDALNSTAGAATYGLIKQEGFEYDGYLSLTNLGALTNSLHGYGTESAPFIINNASDLRTLAYIVSTGRDITDNLFKLTANIDMTNEQEMAPIGDTGHPFSGIFDGCGHYIRGMKAKDGYMFITVTGTVKNLALDDFKSQNENVFAGIAYYVGKYGTNGGTIENCYVTGDADLKITETFQPPLFGGICNTVGTTGAIRNCYYTGNVQFGRTTLDQSFSKPLIGGIAETANGEVTNCYAVFNFHSDLSAKGLKATLGGIASYGTPRLSANNYYHYNLTYTEQEPDIKMNDGTTAVDSESKISAATLGEAWKNGMRHPVLKSAYHYDCKDADGNDAALDPTGYVPTDNSILTLVPATDQTTDAKMWQLPNVAVYSQDMDAEILTNFSIIPDTETQHYPLRYKSTKEGVAVKGSVTYPWSIRKGLNLRSFCLPGSVSLDQLPEGCKMYVGGTLTSDGEDTYKMNIIEVETVPAGVPFFVRYDNPGEAQTYNITMTGDLALKPQKASEASSLSGTYVYLPEGGHNSIIEESEGKLVMPYSSAIGTNCFQAYVATDYAGYIDLTNYLLLDEQSNETDNVLYGNDGQTLNIKLRRDLKTGGWNTLCLPFELNESWLVKLLGNNSRMEKLTNISYDNATQSLVLEFTYTNKLEAGKPYLVYPTKAGSIHDINKRTLTNETKPITFENINMGNNSLVNVSMIGSYSKFYLMSTEDEDQYFLQQDKFYRATAEQPVISNGYRCWFKVTSSNGVKAENLQSARIIHADGSTTNIKLVNVGKTKDGSTIYDLQGISHNQMQKGINIVGGKKILKK